MIGASEPVGQQQLAEEHGRALAALRQSEERWRLIVETANDAFIGMDVDGRIIDWNREAEALFGWTRDEVLGLPLAETIIPPDLRDAHRQGLERFLATGEGPVLFQRIELPGLHRDGTSLDLEVTIWPSRAGETWRFNAFLRDIAEQKRAMSYVELLQEVAVTANSRLPVADIVCRTLDTICAATGWPVGHLYFTDEREPGRLVPSSWWHFDDGTPQAFRAVTEDMTFERGRGLPGRVLATAGPVWVIDTSAADEDYPRAALVPELGPRSAFAFPVRIGDEVVAVLEFLAAGTERPPEPAFVEVMDNVGTQLGRVFERDRSARDLQRVNAELRAADELRTQFISIVSHELRSPLSAILGFASLMNVAWDETGDADKREYVRSIERQSRRLVRLVNDLLTVSRLEAGVMQADPSVVPLDRLVREVVRDLGIPDVVIEVGNTAVRADRDHTVQIVVNTLKNAERHGDPPIEVTAAAADDAVELRIRDHGPGVPDRLLPRLYERFMPGDRTIRREGTGLGLSIVRGLAEANGGQAWYEHGHPGAVFVVRLPAATART